MNTEELKAKLLGGGSKPKKKPKRGLSTGSTLLNLALTGDPNWGLAPSCFYFLVGDSKSGKTFLALNCLAEAAVHPYFSRYRLIYDGPERGARMDIGKFFGPKLAKELEKRASSTIEDFYFGLDDILDEEKPFIYVLDSESSLSSEDETDKFQANKTAYRKGRDMAGSYGDGKAKKHSSNLRQIYVKLEKSKSILIMISQSRDNIGFGSQFNPKTRGGGRALTFYNTGECWFTVKKSIKKTVAGKPRKIGNLLCVQIKKNRETGYEPEIDLHHYWSIGFDDIGSIIGWLIEENHWRENKGVIESEEFNYKGRVEGLRKKIIQERLKKELVKIAADVWNNVLSECMVMSEDRYK